MATKVIHTHQQYTVKPEGRVRKVLSEKEVLEMRECGLFCLLFPSLFQPWSRLAVFAASGVLLLNHGRFFCPQHTMTCVPTFLQNPTFAETYRSTSF